MPPRSSRPARPAPAAETSARPAAELATLRRRLASMLYEVLLLLGVLGLTYIAPLVMIGVAFEYAPPGGLQWVYIFLVLAGYFLWYWRKTGQTLAMQTWKLQLVARDGSPITLKQGWIRYALAWPSVLLGGLGLAWAIIDPERQFLHDRLAGTRIVLLTGAPTA